MYSINYNYDKLISTYLTQSAESGVTAQGRMSFRGDTLYSYKSKLFQRVGPNTYILDVATRSYSVTTAKHTTRILRSMPSDVTIYHTYIDNPVWQNVAIYVTDLKFFIGQFKRARTTKSAKQKLVIRKYNELQSYIEFTKLDKRTSAYKQFKQLFAIMFEAKVL
jgi:hypothetical protein